MIINNKKWKKISITIVVFTVVVLLFEIFPRIWDLGSLAVSWIDNSNKLNRIDIVNSELSEHTTTNEQLKLQINQIVSDYEKNKNISTTMRYLNSIAKKSKINISSIKPKKLKSNENLWLQPIELEFYSNYEELYNFVRFLENSEKVILVTEIDIKPVVITRRKLKTLLKIDVYMNL